MNQLANREIINELNNNLSGNRISNLAEEGPPPIFIIGLPRSGTTVVEQVILEVFKFGYIDNIAAKFWNAPEYGIAISTELKPFYRRTHGNFKSKLGFTEEVFGPHEFGYFWKRFFSYEHGDHQVSDHINKKDKQNLKQEIKKLGSIFQLPFVFKNPVAITLNAKLLREIFPEALFIVVEREKVEVADSLLKAREKVCGNINKWFSGIPASCRDLSKDSDPVLKVLQQVEGYKSVVDEFKKFLSGTDKINLISLESFTENPKTEIEKLKIFFERNNLKLGPLNQNFDESLVKKGRSRLKWGQEIKNAMEN